MKLSRVGEFGLIERIRKLSHTEEPRTIIGIGDDAAAIKLSTSSVMLVTTDLLLEDVHFDLSYTDFFSLGWKSAAVNLSDIAAMGGAPRFFLTALGLPQKISAEKVFDFYRGFNSLLRKHKTVLVGGDTCSSRAGLFISVTAIGEAKASKIITRSGAKPGDRIYVTGTLGDSAAGLEILRMSRVGRGLRNSKNRAQYLKSAVKQLVEKHIRPVPRIAAARAIAASGCASAMIDVSDGLSSDLSHICTASGTGADIMLEKIPVSRSLRSTSSELSKELIDYALTGGEDYELLFTVPPSRIQKLHSLELPATEIGAITRGGSLFLISNSGKRAKIRPKGYDHFRSEQGGFRTKFRP